MRPLEELVRPNIRTLKPYSTARDEFSGGEITTWLDANENPYDNGVNRYPDPHQKLLKQKIAALKGVREEQVFIGNGSDEAIDLCYRIFCRPGVDNAVSIAPTYGMYRVAADINDVEMREVPLGADFSLPTDALLAAADERTRSRVGCGSLSPGWIQRKPVAYRILKVSILGAVNFITHLFLTNSLVRGIVRICGNSSLRPFPVESFGIFFRVLTNILKI